MIYCASHLTGFYIMGGFGIFIHIFEHIQRISLAYLLLLLACICLLGNSIKYISTVLQIYTNFTPGIKTSNLYFM